ncbi:MAG: hypothetical protein H7066_07655 [Cytophagaceae bacterium]|nr:hypothetical protein [Gemmatimonadaceae bacterium]
MKSVRDSDPRHARAIRIAKVKFVMLPAAYDLQATASARAPARAGAPTLLSTLRGFISRVLGRP